MCSSIDVDIKYFNLLEFADDTEYEKEGSWSLKQNDFKWGSSGRSVDNERSVMSVG